MKIEVKKLIALGKYTGSLVYDYSVPEILCVIPLCRIDSVAKVKVDYEIYEDDAVGVTLTVNYRIAGKCSYCLNDAEKQIEFTSDILFVPEKDDENYYYDGVNIDLTTAVDDAILISQPQILLCKEDCTGIDVNPKND